MSHVQTSRNSSRHSLANLFDDLTPFDDLFKGFLVRPLERQYPAAPVAMKLDVREDERSYTVHADLPGVKKEQIDVQIDGNLVIISAEVRNEREVKEGEKLLHTERYTGRLSRSFQLAQEVNEAEAVARFTDGVLELTLPKRLANENRRRLAIQ